MKKKLEAELISIAHRILKLKNKADIVQLHQETQKLYEKLSVLRFVEENFGEVKPTIGMAEIEEKIESAFEDQSALVEEETELEPEIEVVQKEIEETEETQVEEDIDETLDEQEIDEEELVVEEAISENIEIERNEYEKTLQAAIVEATENDSPKETLPEQDMLFKPSFELSFDAVDELKTEVASTPSPLVLEDLLGPNYVDPVFVTPEDLETERQQSTIEKPIENFLSQSINENKEDDNRTLNDRGSKGITIGLNDRLGFIQHLFANNAEDYNRVLSQLITFDSMQEVQLFIDDMVKPDFNNWDGKEEYAQRFMEIIEKKFS